MKIEMYPKIERRLLLGAMRQHRLRLLNKSVLSPGVRDTDGKGEGKWDESQGVGMETLSYRYLVVESVPPAVAVDSRKPIRRNGRQAQVVQLARVHIVLVDIHRMFLHS